MKLAYVAADKSVLRTASTIAKYYQEIHFYFSEENLTEVDKEVEKLPIVTENVCIPADEKLRTLKHKAVLKRLKSKKNEFYNEIYTVKVPSDGGYGEISIEPIIQEHLFSDINFIKYSRESGRYQIENTKNEVVEYDYLLLQNNQYIMNAILEKQQNLFNFFTEQSRCLLTLEFEIELKHRAPQVDRDFLFIENSILKSIDDNWYIIALKEKTMRVSFYIPIEVQKNREYLEFLNKRVADVIEQNFITIRIKGLTNSYRHPVDGYFNYRAKLRNSKGGSMVPTYLFWSREKVDSHLNQILKARQNQLLKEKKKFGVVK